MNLKSKIDSKLTANSFIDSMIRVGIIAVLVVLCVRVFSPFLTIMVWALILSIVLYPIHQRLANKRFKGRQGLASTLIVIIGLSIIGFPMLMLGDSFASHIGELKGLLEGDGPQIAAPDPGVADWPIIGEKAYAAWSQASDNFPQFVTDHTAQLEKLWQKIVTAGGNAIGSIFLILGALIISGIMMAYGKTGGKALERILIRFTGSAKGTQLYELSAGTVRSVATGVLGVAFIQALIFGIGFMIAGIPAAGVLAIIVMFIGIIQLPAAIISIPVIAYVWISGDASVGANIFYTVFFVIAGLSDNVLKPLLLGRGVDSPMPVILIGALGGMIAGGFIGMFLGAILLAIGYHIFMDWVNGDKELNETEVETETETTVT